MKIGLAILTGCFFFGAVSAQDSTFSYKVFPIEGLNSTHDDICPTPHYNKVVFTSARSVDHVSGHKPQDDDAYFKIYTAKLKYDLGQIEGCSRPVLAPFIFQGDKHDGPACFSPDGKTVWFTRSRGGSKKGGAPILAIHTSSWQKDKWSKPELMKLNGSDFSSAHPAISSDGKTLWFSSNRPGSKGGMDLWKCNVEKGVWGIPVNAGEMLNTPENEVYPSFQGEALFFSSKGHGTMGGYDIFRVDFDEENAMVERLPQPINSVNDDFGICFLDDRKGLFTTNRPGGIGGDDIMGFMISRANEKLVSIIGVLKKNGVPLEGVELGLLEKKSGLRVRETVTGEGGVFRFDDLQKGEEYLLDINGTADAVDLLNEDGKVIGAMVKGPNGFVFTALPFDEMDQLALIDEGDPMLLGLEIEGQVFRNAPGDVLDTMNIQVLDSLGRIHYATTTRDSGKFTFERVPPYDAYRFRLDPTPENVLVRVFDPKGNVDIKPDKWSELFTYERLNDDENYITIIDQNGNELHLRMDENYRIPLAYYDLDKWELNEEAKEELKRVAALLLINEHIKAELSSHTDSRGTAEYNLDLSEKRAKAAVEHLILLGVPEEAISAQGLGESRLISKCADEVPCTEQEYARDRRTELRITLR